MKTVFMVKVLIRVVLIALWRRIIDLEGQPRPLAVARPKRRARGAGAASPLTTTATASHGLLGFSAVAASAS